MSKICECCNGYPGNHEWCPVCGHIDVYCPRCDGAVIDEQCTECGMTYDDAEKMHDAEWGAYWADVDGMPFEDTDPTWEEYNAEFEEN